MKHKLSSTLVALLLLAPPVVVAQSASTGISQDDQCRRAVRIVTHERTESGTEWAYSYLAACGADGGTAAATVLRRLRTSSDTALLQRRTGPLRAFRDAAVFEAALDVAGDRKATPEARVFAFRTIMFLRDARLYADYRDLVATFKKDGSPEATCGGRLSDGTFSDGAPLPGDWRARADSVRNRVWANRREPDAVRSAAWCT